MAPDDDETTTPCESDSYETLGNNGSVTSVNIRTTPTTLSMNSREDEMREKGTPEEETGALPMGGLLAMMAREGPRREDMRGGRPP